MKRLRWLALAPGGLFVAWLVTSEILGTPPELPRAPDDLTMPGDRPIRWIERAQNRFVALKMDGVLIEAGADQLVVRLGETIPDAQVSVVPETVFFLDGAPVSVAKLPLGGEVSVTYDVVGERRVASRVDAMPPAAGPPPPNAAKPIVPAPPGAKLKDGVPPNAAPAQPQESRPPQKMP